MLLILLAFLLTTFAQDQICHKKTESFGWNTALTKSHTVVWNKPLELEFITIDLKSKTDTKDVMTIQYEIGNKKYEHNLSGNNILTINNTIIVNTISDVHFTFKTQGDYYLTALITSHTYCVSSKLDIYEIFLLCIYATIFCCFTYNFIFGETVEPFKDD